MRINPVSDSADFHDLNLPLLPRPCLTHFYLYAYFLSICTILSHNKITCPVSHPQCTATHSLIVFLS